jgi:2-isopropylmalate synthase
VRYREHHLFEQGAAQGIRLNVEIRGTSHLLIGQGNGPIDAAVHALSSAGISVQVRSYEERSMSASKDAGDARACAFMEIADAGEGVECYGVGMDSNIVTASIKALLSGVNRAGVFRQALRQRAA